MTAILSPEASTLVTEAVERMMAAYDDDTGLILWGAEGKPALRETLYAALGLLILGRDPARAARMVGAALDLQLLAPGEIWHGCFRHGPDEPPPPPMPFNWRRLSPEGRYFADITWERFSARYARLLADSPLDPEGCKAAGEALRRALFETVPVVWETYEPNLREFAGMVFTMLLEHFDHDLPGCLVERIEESARQLILGAMDRVRSGLTPLNTNIRIMYIFILDFFGRRLKEPSWREEALREARELLKEYREFHAVAEFNSPTYYGVDLSTVGFWRRYGSGEEIRALGAELEDGLWHDAADFYDPDLRNFCGPYSRNYEMDMRAHTAFYALMYLGLGAERFPWHPVSEESVCDPLLVLGQVTIPEDVIPLLTGPCVPRYLRRSFRELSERGDPACRHALCTAEARITPTLMAGVLSGSENPSHQLHPLTVFWRAGEDIGTIRLQRSLPDGTMDHLHTVLFDGRFRDGRMDMRVDNRAGRDVDVFFEVSCPGLTEKSFLPETWDLPGLTVRLRPEAPGPEVRRVDENTVRVIYPSRMESPGSLSMRFLIDLVQKAPGPFPQSP